MHVTVSAERFERELRAWLTARIEKDSHDIVAGVPVEMYKERCAAVRTLKQVLAELPALIKKAKDA
jgi:hypothetical protein